MFFARKAFVVLGLSLAAAPAAWTQELPPSLLACTEESDSLKRLVCFDREVARLKGQSAPVASTQAPPAAAAPAAPPVAPAQPPASGSAVDDFGVTGDLARRRKQEEKDAPAPVQEMEGTVAKVAKKPYGELVIELQNGQVWEQPERKYGFIIKEGEHIRITRGAMGSFFLVSDSGATTRVRRVR